MPYVIAIVVIVLLFLCLKVVPQATEYVIERLGKYNKTWSAGLHFLIPVIDRVSKKVTLKEQVLDSPHSPLSLKIMLPCKLILWFTLKCLIPSFSPMVQLTR